MITISVSYFIILYLTIVNKYYFALKFLVKLLSKKKKNSEKIK